MIVKVTWKDKHTMLTDFLDNKEPECKDLKFDTTIESGGTKFLAEWKDDALYIRPTVGGCMPALLQKLRLERW